MEKLVALFKEFVVKAITMTEEMLANDLSDMGQLEAFTANRERLLKVVDQIGREINWTDVDEAVKADCSLQIDYIKKLDEKLLTKLQEHQATVKREIELTVRQKENVKGYNLNDTK
jgi:hypothetical protein